MEYYILGNSLMGDNYTTILPVFHLKVSVWGCVLRKNDNFPYLTACYKKL